MSLSGGRGSHSFSQGSTGAKNVREPEALVPVPRLHRLPLPGMLLPCRNDRSRNKPSYVTFRFVITSRRDVHSSGSPVVCFAEPFQVSGCLYPRANIVGVAYPGVVFLQPRQVHAVLQ